MTADHAMRIPHLTPLLPSCLSRRPWLREFVYFGFKQAWACIFGGLLLFGILATAIWFPDIGISRYDFLFCYALGIQLLLLAFRLESWRELGVIMLFHIMATAMELFKTSGSIGSWNYPESSIIRIANVPLFAGFMYSAVPGMYFHAPIREPHPIFRQAVDMGCGDFSTFRVVARHIAEPEVIRIQDDKVGLGALSRQKSGCQQPCECEMPDHVHMLGPNGSMDRNLAPGAPPGELDSPRGDIQRRVPMQPVEEFTTIESVFVRQRNALVLRGKFAPIYTDYYLHLMQHGIRLTPELDQMLKDSLAMLTLHLVARPWSETIAWTVNLRAPRINLFVTGGSTEGTVTGRIFTEDVREPDRNFFYSQTSTPHQTEPRTSTLEVDGRDPVHWVSQLYDQSEQRPSRAFRLEDEEFVLVAAQPDCDLDWFAALTPESVAAIDATEETKLLETRNFRFHCGCTLDRILPVLGNWRNRLEDLFHDANHIRIQCPRCAANYDVTRDMIL